MSNGRRVVCMCPQGEGRNTDKVLSSLEWSGCAHECVLHGGVWLCVIKTESALWKCTQELKWALAYVVRTTLTHCLSHLHTHTHSFADLPLGTQPDTRCKLQH